MYATEIWCGRAAKSDKDIAGATQIIICVTLTARSTRSIGFELEICMFDAVSGVRLSRHDFANIRQSLY